MLRWTLARPRSVVVPVGCAVVAGLAVACVRAPAGRAAGATRSAPVPATRSGAARTGARRDTDAVIEEVFTRTNAERRAAGLPPLTRNVNLMVAAQIQASQMASRNLMAHEIPGTQYPTLRSRLDAVSYPVQAAGENIAAGYDGGAEAVSGWMRSSGHRANILSTSYTELGTSVALARDGTAYYAQVFGRPR